MTGVLGKKVGAKTVVTPTGFSLGQEQDDGSLRGIFIDNTYTRVDGPLLVPFVTGSPSIYALSGINLSSALGGAGTMTTGTGAPTASGARGDFYFRTDTPTTANQRIYINTSATIGTTWTGIV